MAAGIEFEYDEFLANNPKFSQDDLRELRRWIDELDPGSVVPKDMHDKQLLIFYNACRLVVEDTKKCIKSYYSIRDSTPEFFDDRDLEKEPMKTSLETLETFILPESTDEGYDIIFHRLHVFEVSKYNFINQATLMFMAIDACLYHRGPRPGFIFLLDMKGVTLGHLSKLSITGIAKLCKYIKDALPVNMKVIHILNTPSFFDKILFLIKPFLSKEIIDLITLHDANEDMERFYKECIPKRALPPDFGGESPDTQTLHKKSVEILKSLKPYFDAEENHRHLYSKKSKKKSKLESEFSGLNID